MLRREFQGLAPRPIPVNQYPRRVVFVEAKERTSLGRRRAAGGRAVPGLFPGHVGGRLLTMFDGAGNEAETRLRMAYGVYCGERFMVSREASAYGSRRVLCLCIEGR